jgi:isopenicillin N synthase-like dioxygenase
MLETIPAADLEARDAAVTARVQAALASAFGPGGPGILAVSGLPSWYASARTALLESARAFSALPASRRSAYECAHADYAVGWSCGRERFRGVVDTMKGSFYANPCFDDPSGGDAARATEYKHLLGPNVWPSGEDKVRVGMEAPFKRVGRYIDAVGKHLAWHCDRYVEAVTGCVPFTRLHDALEHSRAQKGRLLHYFPLAHRDQSAGSEGSEFWCGTHCDHGALTGLVAGEFYDIERSVVLDRSSDPTAGLYVAPHGAEDPIRVTFPPNSIAFQTGEVAQIVSGGVLCATAHAVRAGAGGPVCRSTLAVFLQPNPDYPLQLPPWDAEGRAALISSPLVPPLASRYGAGDTFAAFGAKSIEAYVVGDG